jgi:hypothetical protein
MYVGSQNVRDVVFLWSYGEEFEFASNLATLGEREVCRMLTIVRQVGVVKRGVEGADPAPDNGLEVNPLEYHPGTLPRCRPVLADVLTELTTGARSRMNEGHELRYDFI